MSDVSNADLSSLRINRSAPQEKVPRPWLKWISYAIVLALLIYGWFAFKSLTLDAIDVDVANAVMVSPSQSNAVLTASGYVVAQRKAAVSSKVSGRLVALNVIEGDVVRANEVIARIESEDVQSLVMQLRAALELAKADVESAQAELDDAKLESGRKKILYEGGATSKADLDMAVARFRKAEAALKARQAAVGMAEANVRNAEVQFENTIIRAPFDGTVLTKNANVGEVITVLGAAAGSRGAVVTIADMNSLEVEADVSESNVERISMDQDCEVTLDAYPDKRYAASVSKIIPTADRAKATVQVKVRFRDKDARVLPEMSAKVLFLKPDAAPVADNAKQKLIVPMESVVEKEGRKYVFLLRDNRAVRVEVGTGERTGSSMEITQGLEAGEKVIVSPISELHDGSKVQIRK